jgi:hypothetical protein
VIISPAPTVGHELKKSSSMSAKTFDVLVYTVTMAKFALRIYRHREWKELAMCLINLIYGVANCFDSCNQ